MEKNDAFIKRLLATFKVEAAEHIASLSSGLIELEKTLSPERQAEVIEIVFREAHGMKGAARSVNLSGIENVCQAFESVLAALKRKELAPEREILDLLHRSVNMLGGLLSTVETGEAPPENNALRGLVRELNKAAKAPPRAERTGEEQGPPIELRQPSYGEVSVPLTAVPSSLPTDTMRISKAKLDSLLLQGEGFLSVKQASAQQAAELREITAVVAGLKKSLTTLRPDLRAAQAAGGKENAAATAGVPARKLLDFLESGEDRITKLHHSLVSLGKSLHQGQRSIGAMVDGLLDDLKSVSMLPFSSLLEMMPKLVRDLSRDQGKEATLVTRGGEIELDKRILDEMKEPLIHLVRNCIDHGIEKPEERVLEKKPLAGTITIAVALREGKSMELVVSDDGRGVDTAKVKGSAIRLGILSREEAGGLDERSAGALIFRSGVTASPIITDLSGRGLGLAIVRERVERLGGTIVCETTEGEGAAFRILLPLTLTTFRGVLVRVSGSDFVIPTANLDRTVRVRRDEIRSIENRETISC
jgi:two-component system chemotaxis sensor kinase CheA